MSGVVPPIDRVRRALAGIRTVPDDAGAVAEIWARVGWNIVTEPGDGAAGRMVDELGAAIALEEMLTGGSVLLARGDERARGRERWVPRWRPSAIEEACEAAARGGVRLVVPGDEEWPGALEDLGPHAPMCLWVRGDAFRLRPDHGSVALVGARASTSYGEHIAAEMAADLASSGIAIVSGAAYGIDGAAHRSALTVGGVTLALLAGGADRAYPSGHTDLIDRIAVSGAVISEVPCGSAPTKWRFLQRNRLIAALAEGTVVVEAGWRSGSLNTAGHAAALGRPLGAVPGPVTSAASAGCHRLLREYGATCVTDAADVRELLGRGENLMPGPDRGRTDRSTRLMDALSVRVEHGIAELVRRSGLSSEEVEAELGVLALSGIVERGSVGWRRLIGA